MKKNLEIIDYEDKKTQAGKRYTRFKTSDGWVSCFDIKTIDELKKWEGKTASVEIVTSGDFSNIKKCYGNAVSEDSEEVEVEKIGKSFNRNTTMYVSYAKDIFCALVDKEKDIPDQMESAIALVKRAKEAFE